MSVSVRVTYRNPHGEKAGGNYGFEMANSNIAISCEEELWGSGGPRGWDDYPPSCPSVMMGGTRYELTEEEENILQSHLLGIPCPFAKPKGTDASFKRGKVLDDHDLQDLAKYLFCIDAGGTEQEGIVESLRLRVWNRLQATFRRKLLALTSENKLYVRVELQPEGTPVREATIMLTSNDAFLLGKQLILASQGFLESQEVIVGK